MGASKDLFMEIRIQAETSEDQWNALSDEVKEVFNMKRIEVDKIQGVEAKEVYRKDPRWKAANSELSDVIKHRQEIEEQIRTNLRSKL